MGKLKELVQRIAGIKTSAPERVREPEDWIYHCCLAIRGRDYRTKYASYHQ